MKYYLKAKEAIGSLCSTGKKHGYSTVTTTINYTWTRIPAMQKMHCWNAQNRPAAPSRPHKTLPPFEIATKVFERPCKTATGRL